MTMKKPFSGCFLHPATRTPFIPHIAPRCKLQNEDDVAPHNTRNAINTAEKAHGSATIV